MAASINRVVAGRVFRNHRVSKEVFVTSKLLRVAKQPSFLLLQKLLLFGQFAFWWGGNCRLDFGLHFPPIKSQFGRLSLLLLFLKKLERQKKVPSCDAQQCDGYRCGEAL